MPQKNKVSICTGTACFVMGGSELLLLEEELPAALRAATEIDGTTCFGLCKDKSHENAPFVKINGEVLEQATVQRIIERLAEITGRQEISSC
jgi:NADH:ubiquinone oxidoreductase subunit E